MNRFYLVLCVLLAFGVSAQAGVVPGGDFGMYKPGTMIPTIAPIADDIWVQTMGPSRPLSGGGPVTFGDSSTGDVVDCDYGWIAPPGERMGDLFTPGVDLTDGTSCFNAFAGWGGGNGNLMESAAPLTVDPLGPGEVYELSAMVVGPGGPRALELWVGGVLLAPDVAVDPPYIGKNGGLQNPEDWAKMYNQYSVLPAGDVKVRVGVYAGGEPFGSRAVFDNVTFGPVPEPATMLLLGLGGLGLIRRKR